MNKTKAVSILLLAAFILSTIINCSASGVYYLPDVTGEMSSPSYWTKEDTIIMTSEEIEKLNKETISAKGTNMYDLKNQPEVVDGIALNEALLKSGKADASYYLGWTYLESDKKATMEDFDEMIENTQNSDAKREQEVFYGIATKRTYLSTFPSDIAIWDDPNDSDLDYQYLSSVRVNEPLVIISKSKDGKYYLAKNICCSGWIPAHSVAICKDKEEWIFAWDIKSDEALVVWGDKVYTENSVMGEVTSDLMLTMGTVLKLEKNVNPNELIDNRAAYNNYVVHIPVRNEDGTYSDKLTLISEHKKVHAGYMPLTKANISKVVFSALGNTYGWGGSLYSDDCSGYMRNVYKCFGMELARNTTWQSAMPMAKIDMQNMLKEERIKILEGIPFGSILYFNGHEMMYLGAENGKYYVISAVGSMMQPGSERVRQRIRSFIVNTLEVKRANGNMWIDELTLALVPFFGADNESLPGYDWYHDGMVYCIKKGIMTGDENKYFNPSEYVSWADVFEILYGMEKVNEESGKDISENERYITWAKDNDLVYDIDKDFKSETKLSRQQLATILYLYAKYKGYDVSVGEETNILSYDDVFDIAEYAIPAMQFAAGAGIINGKTESTLNPTDVATRAELAVILERFLGYSARMEEIKKTKVDYTKDFYSFVYHSESSDPVIELFETIDRTPYGTAGASLSQVVSGIGTLELSKKKEIKDKLSEYLDGMNATELDFFSFQWQMCVKLGLAIIDNPDSYLGLMSDAGVDLVDLTAFNKDEFYTLNNEVMEELKKRGVKDEWKNHLEIEPFIFWK